jgi:hypothetical protein
MAVLGREDFMNKLKTLVGDDTSEDTLTTIADFTDTYNTLDKNNGIDWEQKLKENDETWRKKYKDAFFSPPVNQHQQEQKNEQDEDEETKRASSISINDLFK